MAKFKLGTIAVDKPVKLTVQLPADVQRDLVEYAQALARETGQSISDPGKLIAPMVERFTATDRAFARARRAGQVRSTGKGQRFPNSSKLRRSPSVGRSDLRLAVYYQRFNVLDSVLEREKRSLRCI